MRRKFAVAVNALPSQDPPKCFEARRDVYATVAPVGQKTVRHISDLENFQIDPAPVVGLVLLIVVRMLRFDTAVIRPQRRAFPSGTRQIEVTYSTG
jgi:hypothetical protein